MVAKLKIIIESFPTSVECNVISVEPPGIQADNPISPGSLFSSSG